MAIPTETTRDRIREEAYRLLVERGVAGLSMRALAERLNIKASSLYKHVRDKDEILLDLQARGLEALAAAVTAAGAWPSAAVYAYRDWALENRHLYEICVRRPLHRGRLSEELEKDVATMINALSGQRDEGARAVWGTVHGLVDLELTGRFANGVDLDTTWRRAIAMLR
ncbi:MAG TPA: TetR/AcrR family transcriptional regulator [Acidimicrobiales bacterium]|nr:TetR/AcrR family transcriptional regulator [Acidimicrobiales bacterium]